MEWSSGFVDASHLRIHYLRTGGDKQPLVLLHGYTDNGRCWSPVARHFQADYDVIMPDARGHGASSSPDAPYSDADQADDVLSLVSALGLCEVCMIGHSMGAVVAVVAATRDPRRVDKLVLEEPPPSPGRIARNPMGEAVQRASLAKYRASTLPALIARGQRTYPGWSAEEIELWAASKLELDVNVARRFSAPLPRWDLLLDELACPYLLLTGEPKLGSVMHDEDLADLAAHLRNGSALRIAGAGHSVHRDRLDEYIRVVAAFLTGIPRQAPLAQSVEEA